MLYINLALRSQFLAIFFFLQVDFFLIEIKFFLQVEIGGFFETTFEKTNNGLESTSNRRSIVLYSHLFVSISQIPKQRNVLIQS